MRSSHTIKLECLRMHRISGGNKLGGDCSLTLIQGMTLPPRNKSAEPEISVLSNFRAKNGFDTSSS